MRLCFFVISVSAAAAQSYTTWRDYAGSADAAQYSGLKHIDRAKRQRSAQPMLRRSLCDCSSGNGWQGLHQPNDRNHRRDRRDYHLEPKCDDCVEPKADQQDNQDCDQSHRGASRDVEELTFEKRTEPAQLRCDQCANRR